jgi:hypothetical protein
MRLAVNNGFDDGEQVEGGPGQAIDAGDDDDVCSLQPGKQSVELAPIWTCTAGFLAEDAAASGGMKILELGLELLANRLHTRIAVQRPHRHLSHIICKA